MTSKNNYKAWIYLDPSLILLIIFAIYPLLDTFFISFLKDYNYINGKSNGLTLDNYKVLFQIIPPPSHIPGLSAPISAFFSNALPNTLLITSNKDVLNILNKDLILYENDTNPIFDMINDIDD